MSSEKPIDLAAVRRLREERREWLKQHPSMTTPDAQERLEDHLEGEAQQETNDDGTKEDKEDDTDQ